MWKSAECVSPAHLAVTPLLFATGFGHLVSRGIHRSSPLKRCSGWGAMRSTTRSSTANLRIEYTITAFGLWRNSCTNSIHHASRKRWKSGTGLSCIVLHVIICNAISVAWVKDTNVWVWAWLTPYWLCQSTSQCFLAVLCLHSLEQSCSMLLAMPCINSDVFGMLEQ